jgi:hypothetical protein
VPFAIPLIAEASGSRRGKDWMPMLVPPGFDSIGGIVADLLEVEHRLQGMFKLSQISKRRTALIPLGAGFVVLNLLKRDAQSFGKLLLPDPLAGLTGDAFDKVATAKKG